MTRRNRWRPALEPRRRRNAYQALVISSILLLFSSLEAAIPSNQAFGGSLGLSKQSAQHSAGGDRTQPVGNEAGRALGL
jgi:hypothetical protein